jgi:acid phosphatase family membrane protein YuiD
VAYEHAMETTLLLVAVICAIACLVIGVEIVRLRSKRLEGALFVASGAAAVAASLMVCATLWGP